MPDSNFTYPPLSVNQPPFAFIRLTDRDDVTYDFRAVAVEDVALLNAAAAESSDGELWWEQIDSDLIHAMHEFIPHLRTADFGDPEAARLFKRQHPDWRVFLTTQIFHEIDASGGQTALSEEEFMEGMGYQ